MTLLSDFQALRKEHAQLAQSLEITEELVKLHEEQINGKRGIQKAIDDNTVAVKSLYRAAYWLAGLIVASSVGFAFAVLRLLG